jgi:mannose-6-phosphate isomerase-like protein (cupin superfamily)
MLPAKNDVETVRGQWARLGFSCELWIDPPDQVWHDFLHDVDELVLLIDGDCQIEMDGRTLRLSAGDEVRIPAGTRHTVRNCGDRPAKWLHGYPFGAARAASG